MWHWCNLAAKESGLECSCMSNDGFTVLVRGDGRRHWMSMCTGWPSHSKWLSELEQWICIKFCVKLEHSSTETIQMIQKATAMGNWWLAVHHDNAPARAEFFGKTSITLMTQPPYSPDLVPWDFWHFPKLKSPLKGKRFQIIDKIPENIKGQLRVIRRTVWGPKVLTLKGTGASLSCEQCFLYLLQ